MRKIIYKIKIFIIFSILIEIVFVSFGCNISTEPREREIFFGIYMFEDSTLKSSDLYNNGPQAYKLIDIPVLSDQDIDFYDYSAHVIFLKTTKEEVFSTFMNKSKISKLDGKHFAFATGKNICFWGIFSFYSSNPFIKDYNAYYPKDILPIERSASYFYKDKRYSGELKNILIETNKYRAGISIEADSIKIFPADSTTIIYNLTIRNNDREDLYVVDPDKVQGKSNFFIHWFIMRNVNSSAGYYNELLRWDYLYSWLTKIEAGKSISRKIETKIKYFLPFGQYYFQAGFRGPYRVKEDRYIYDYRVWAGDILSNTLDITFDKDNNCKINNKNVIFE